MVKLNLGSGGQKIPGFINIDRATGGEAYPLNYPDESVDEIRASHLLEHFDSAKLKDILKDWVRALKPGGRLKIAVPDFDKIVEIYQEKREAPIQGWIMGGQQGPDDYHRSIFNEATLAELMQRAGLVQIEDWDSEISDCASQEISLNLAGYKPAPAEAKALEVKAKVAALMSVPRLGWQVHFGCAQQAFRSKDFDIPLWRFGGAFWEQGMQRGLKALIEDGVEWAITVDYDSIFNSDDVKELLVLAAQYPEADAIVPWQVKRGGKGEYLFSVQDYDGRTRRTAEVEEFERDLTQIATGHFGLTLLKTAALQKMEKPWFWSQPGADGDWGDDRLDADIYFWKKFKEAGCKVFIANSIKIGHIEEDIVWIDNDFEVMRQAFNDWDLNGKPEACR